MAGKALLEVNGVSRVFKRGGVFSRAALRAVDDVSFVIDDRPQIFSIVGESGSGKTTLARMVLRLVEPTAGTMVLDGRPLHADRKKGIDDLAFRRLVQPIFQNPFEAFSAYIPVANYLRMTALNLKVAETEAEADALAAEALEMVGLSVKGVADKYIRQFSGGELQRLSVARALIPKPRLIVADEPVSMVDASLRMSIVNLFKQITEQQSVSFFYITHDLSTAYYLSNQLSIMNKGRVIESGSPDQILANPSEAYTRELMAAVPGTTDKWPEIADIDRKWRSAPVAPEDQDQKSAASKAPETTTP